MSVPLILTVTQQELARNNYQPPTVNACCRNCIGRTSLHDFCEAAHFQVHADGLCPMFRPRACIVRDETQPEKRTTKESTELIDKWLAPALRDAMSRLNKLGETDTIFIENALKACDS